MPTYGADYWRRSEPDSPHNEDADGGDGDTP